MASYENSTRNYLLDALDDSDLKRLLPQLELIPLPLGKVLYDPGTTMRHVYFPVTCVISLLCVMENGATAEIGVIGREGMVGVNIFMGGETSPNQAIVQSTGYAYRARASVLREEFQRNPELQTLLLKYAQTLMSQMAQTAVCNRHHTVDQQLCRWLLTSLDRLPSNELVITQEFIAHMLGVRREGITGAAGKLQRAGIISYRRGRINIVDRDTLEEHACECYKIVKKEYERLLPVPLAAAAPAKPLATVWATGTNGKSYPEQRRSHIASATLSGPSASSL